LAIRLYILGDFNLRLDFSMEPGYENMDNVYHIFERLQKDPGAFSWYVIPAYQSLTISYPWNQSLPEVLKIVHNAINRQTAATFPSRRFVIPVCYGGDLGPDLAFVADFHHLLPDEVIRLHSRADYRVEAIGFSPGFPYLSGLPLELVTARKETPRVRVPAGSVAIGGQQSGIYPVSSPGGWHLIGRTPLILFDPVRTSPIPYRQGDWLHFTPISPAEYQELLAHPLALEVWEKRA
jgi:inhibitor of KinA